MNDSSAEPDCEPTKSDVAPDPPARWKPWVWRNRTKIFRSFILIMHVVGFFTSVRAVMETRTSQGAIAWGVSLNTFPYIAVPAYWIFGQSKFSDYELLRLRDLLAGSDTGREVARVLREEGMLLQVENEDQERQKRLLEALAKLPLTRYNQAELLIDGEETFDAIFSEIDKAKEYILVQFYIMRDDGLGQELKKRLLRKAAEGVRIYILYDELGSKLSKSYIGQLQEAGVLIYPFNTTQGSGNRFQLNFRNHRKIVVVDGRTAFVGGHNVGDEYLGKHPRLTPWRDTHVSVKGPVVLSVQVSFMEDWHWAVGGQWNIDAEHKFNWIPEKAPEGDMYAVCVPTSPADPLETCTLFTLQAINQADDRLWIVSPYFVPDEQLISALQLAALRGVDVRILIPENPDLRMVYYSSFSFLEELQAAGVKIFRYQEGFLHQKVMLIDDYAATVGTVNFDNRSMRLNFEVTMFIASREFAKEVEEMLEVDFSKSRQVDASEYTEASFAFRLIVKLSRLMAPVQ